jgi:hypothetical protein
MKFEKGKSGNPSGRPAVAKEIKELALQHSEEAFRVIIAHMHNEDAKISMAAAKEILDRAYGKPAQAVEVSGKDGGPVFAQIVEYNPKG